MSSINASTEESDVSKDAQKEANQPAHDNKSTHNPNKHPNLGEHENPMISQKRYGAESNVIIGRVSNFNERNEQFGRGNNLPEIIWTFRLDVYEQVGQTPIRYPVEMRGISFEGLIRDGDILEIPLQANSGEILKPKRLRNQTTSSYVSVKARVGNYVVVLFLAVIMLTLFAFMIYQMRRLQAQQQAQFQQDVEKSEELFKQQQAANKEKLNEQQAIDKRQQASFEKETQQQAKQQQAAIERQQAAIERKSKEFEKEIMEQRRAMQQQANKKSGK